MHIAFKTTLGKFFSSLHCFICGEVTSAGDICSACMNDKQGVAVYLSESLRGNGKKIAELNMVSYLMSTSLTCMHLLNPAVARLHVL